MIFTKTPNENADWGFDWAAWLDTGDTISTSTWTVATGLTSGTTGNNTTTTSVWLSGGNAGSNGTSYTCTNKIVTAGGRTFERSFTMRVVSEKYS